MTDLCDTTVQAIRLCADEHAGDQPGVTPEALAAAMGACYRYEWPDGAMTVDDYAGLCGAILAAAMPKEPAEITEAMLWAGEHALDQHPDWLSDQLAREVYTAMHAASALPKGVWLRPSVGFHIVEHAKAIRRLEELRRQS